MANIRIKSQWFHDGASKTPQQQASAMAFITWRVAQNTLKQMRSARFDIEVGAQYFAFTHEVLVFLTQVIDRLAAQRMDDAMRTEFMTALVQRVAQVLQDNEEGLMGEPGAGQGSYADQFIDLYNQLADHYADFGFDAHGPDFAFVRYLGHRIEALMPDKDKRWVVDQVMASEVPDALGMIGRGMDGVLSTEPHAKRGARGAVSGD
ncbi:hypothetical protein [Rhodoferax sp.]|uniref:hypothetical protein n=1 Tax=Rhodoferax sp. TaxID=50421 RepID=UPI002606727B|nr:hypothetical protein [Rhodoferax sp.]MDD5479875.1 hypothetical protein [Rhodoferax sp.]